MIYRRGKATALVTAKGNPSQEVYHGLVLKWQNVRSCYGRGYWIQEKPWLDNDTWKDNR